MLALRRGWKEHQATSLTLLWALLTEDLGFHSFEAAC